MFWKIISRHKVLLKFRELLFSLTLSTDGIIFYNFVLLKAVGNGCLAMPKTCKENIWTHLPIYLLCIFRVVLLPLPIHIIFDVATLRERNPILQFGHVNEFIFVLVNFINDYSGIGKLNKTVSDMVFMRGFFDHFKNCGRTANLIYSLQSVIALLSFQNHSAKCIVIRVFVSSWLCAP